MTVIESIRKTISKSIDGTLFFNNSYRSTRPNGKTTYKQVEQMDDGQTITPKIMRGDEVLWQLEITRLS